MQVRATLRMLKVEQRDCVMEMIRLLLDFEESKLYVLGNDSDFALFKDVNYINFYDYQVVGRRSEARVCLRSNIARKLGLTVSTSWLSSACSSATTTQKGMKRTILLSNILLAKTLQKA